MLKAVIMDVDGVVINGRTMIQGAQKAILEMRAMGLKIFFLSNNSRRSNDSLKEKLSAAGLDVRKGETYTASYAVACYLSENYPGKTVYSFSGMDEELRKKGIKLVDSENAQVVAVGFDREISYEKLAKSFRAIKNGAVFIAANDDPSYPVEDGFLPGAGAMVAAVSFSTEKKPIIVGKPHTYMIELLLREQGLSKNEVIMVGDRLDYDVGMAHAAGVKGVLVLTGVSDRGTLRANARIKPDLVVKSLAELPSSLKKGMGLNQ